jgi:hypothetical protein
MSCAVRGKKLPGADSTNPKNTEAGKIPIEFEGFKDGKPKSFSGTGKKGAAKPVDNDVPVIPGRIWETKRYPRKEFGSEDQALNQVLKYQAAIEKGHYDAATVEVAGNVDANFIRMIRSGEMPDGSHRDLSNVEVLYRFILPNGREVVIPLKEGKPREGSDQKLNSLRTPPLSELTPNERTIVQGIEAALEKGDYQLFSSRILTEADIAGSPHAEKLREAIMEGSVDPKKINDVETFKEFEGLMQAKRIEKFKALADETQPLFGKPQAPDFALSPEGAKDPTEHHFLFFPKISPETLKGIQEGLKKFGQEIREAWASEVTWLQRPSGSEYFNLSGKFRAMAEVVGKNFKSWWSTKGAPTLNSLLQSIKTHPRVEQAQRKWEEFRFERTRAEVSEIFSKHQLWSVHGDVVKELTQRIFEGEIDRDHVEAIARKVKEGSLAPDDILNQFEEIPADSTVKTRPDLGVAKFLPISEVQKKANKIEGFTKEESAWMKRYELRLTSKGISREQAKEKALAAMKKARDTQSGHLIIADTSLPAFTPADRAAYGHLEGSTVDHHGRFLTPDNKNSTMKLLDRFEQALADCNGDADAAMMELNLRFITTDNLADGGWPVWIAKNQKRILSEKSLRDLIRGATEFEDITAFGNNYDRNDPAVKLQAALFKKYGENLKSNEISGSDRFPPEKAVIVMDRAIADIETLLKDPALVDKTAEDFWAEVDAAKEVAKQVATHEEFVGGKRVISIYDMTKEVPVTDAEGKPVTQKMTDFTIFAQWLSVPDLQRPVPAEEKLPLQVTVTPMPPVGDAKRALPIIAIPNGLKLPSGKSLLTVTKALIELEAKKVEELKKEGKLPDDFKSNIWFGKDSVILPNPNPPGLGTVLTQGEIASVLMRPDFALFESNEPTPISSKRKTPSSKEKILPEAALSGKPLISESLKEILEPSLKKEGEEGGLPILSPLEENLPGKSMAESITAEKVSADLSAEAEPEIKPVTKPNETRDEKLARLRERAKSVAIRNAREDYEQDLPPVISRLRQLKAVFEATRYVLYFELREGLA